jgi:hypothetical protein
VMQSSWHCDDKNLPPIFPRPTTGSPSSLE